MASCNAGKHPCFDPEARHRFGRVHLPVAPKCNLGCNFCNRKYDCLNESRPGVTSTVLTPPQAVNYLEKVVDLCDTPVTVMGIAGPGDPFANPNETMQTLRLTRERFPDMLLCVASNGLEIGPHVFELADLGTSHVTITVNAVDPEIGAKIYRFVRPGRRVLRGLEGAKILLENQLDAIDQLKSLGVTVKVNSIVMPGVNDHHVSTIAETVSKLGVDYHNCMALYPLENTPFGELDAPSDEMMASIRSESGAFIDQMMHCQRCRADAAGMLGEDNGELIEAAMAEAAASPADGSRAADRPYFAVASFEGMLVNQHLGAAEQLFIYRRSTGGGYEMIETRPTPVPGDGNDRWRELAGRLHDCRALICSAAGDKPKVALAKHGVRVLVAEGLAEEAIDAVYRGEKPRMPARVLTPSAGCDDDGVGCGGCTGSGTGCG